ncbi:MAG TPA: decarboxylase, partial [Bradyrhizobium sp.]|nr:decarboxylase [Bradyrhizobium sp.]
MATEKPVQDQRIDQFFSGPGARADNWRFLVDAAQAWSKGTGSREKFDALFAPIEMTEEYHGYPGLRLMAALKEAASSGDASATASLATRIVHALQTRSFRQHAGDWEVQEDSERPASELLPQSFGHSDARRPYFEVLIVTGVAAT